MGKQVGSNSMINNNLKRKSGAAESSSNINYEDIHKKVKTVLLNQEINNDDKINQISSFFKISVNKTTPSVS
jgi:hypothetical protein